MTTSKNITGRVCEVEHGKWNSQQSNLKGELRLKIDNRTPGKKILKKSMY